MMSELTVRKAKFEDAAECAAIKNSWIDQTSWMPRIHPADDVVRYYREAVLPNREVFVIGTPIEGYLVLDRSEGFVTSLYCQTKRAGLGKKLLDHAKALMGRTLKLWTFVANEGALKFYAREGFREICRSDGDNEENLPDVLLQWEAIN